MNKVILVIIISLALLILPACSDRNDTSEIATGTVTIISNGKTYAPLENWINSLENSVAADGAGLQPKEVADELEAIPCGDDFEIVIDGEPLNGISYTLYNNDYEEEYYREAEFFAPQNEGIYILSVEASWGNEKAYDGYQYCFKLEVAPSPAESSQPSDSEIAFSIDDAIVALYSKEEIANLDVNPVLEPIGEVLVAGEAWYKILLKTDSYTAEYIVSADCSRRYCRGAYDPLVDTVEDCYFPVEEPNQLLTDEEKERLSKYMMTQVIDVFGQEGTAGFWGIDSICIVNGEFLGVGVANYIGEKDPHLMDGGIYAVSLDGERAYKVGDDKKFHLCDDSAEDQAENTATSEFSLGPDGEVITMRTGDILGPWTLTDMQISCDENKAVWMLTAEFTGNETLRGIVTRDGMVEYGYIFTTIEEDKAKIPHYVNPDAKTDQAVFSLNFAEYLEEEMSTVYLEPDEKMDVTITVSDYHYTFAYMTAPSSATVVDMKSRQ